MLTDQENEVLHGLSTQHRELVSMVAECSCYHCLERFPRSAIQSWVDGDQTALCPACGVDAVLPEIRLSIEGGLIISSLSLGVLRALQQRWFGALLELEAEARSAIA